MCRFGRGSAPWPRAAVPLQPCVQARRQAGTALASPFNLLDQRHSHIASRGTASRCLPRGQPQAHRRAFRNIYTRPGLHCPGERRRTLGMTPRPRHLCCGPAATAFSACPPGHCPPMRPAPPPNSVQYSNLGSCPPAPSPAAPCRCSIRLSLGRREEGMQLSVNPLLAQACLACCKDQSQTPRATGPTGMGPQVPRAPLLLMWPLQARVPGCSLCGCTSASHAPFSWPAEDSQQPTLPLTWGLSS